MNKVSEYEKNSRSEAARRRELENMIREKDLALNKFVTEAEFLRKQSENFKGDFDVLHAKLATVSSHPSYVKSSYCD